MAEAMIEDRNVLPLARPLDAEKFRVRPVPRNERGRPFPHLGRGDDGGIVVVALGASEAVDKGPCRGLVAFGLTEDGEPFPRVVPWSSARTTQARRGPVRVVIVIPPQSLSLIHISEPTRPY